MKLFWLIGIILQLTTAKPLIFAHYMAWFLYPNVVHWPPNSGMYYTPIVGYYSSQNETVIEWQLSLMQQAGIDGIIVDWYGTSNSNDYPFIKSSTDLIWNIIKTKYPNLKLGICYDFNSQVNSNDIFDNSMNYLKNNYFYHSQYLKYTDGNPIMIIFPSYNSQTTFQTPNGINSALASLGLSNLYVFSEFRNPAFNFADNSYTNLGLCT